MCPNFRLDIYILRIKNKLQHIHASEKQNGFLEIGELLITLHISREVLPNNTKPQSGFM